MVAFFIFLLISGIKLGEAAIYTQRAMGMRGRFALLFKYLSPAKAIRALNLYNKIVMLQFLWFIYFILPGGLCLGIACYLTNNSAVKPVILSILITGGAILSATGIIFSHINNVRFCSAEYFLLSKSNISAKAAIEMSTQATDGKLAEGAILRYSLSGWLVSCVFLLPIIYTVPYYKMCRCIFAEESANKGATSNSFYAINYLSLSNQPII